MPGPEPEPGLWIRPRWAESTLSPGPLAKASDEALSRALGKALAEALPKVLGKALTKYFPKALAKTLGHTRHLRAL